MINSKRPEVINNPLVLSGLFIGMCIVVAITYPELFSTKLPKLIHNLLRLFGSFYLYLGLASVLVLLCIAFSKVGKIKLGNSKPRYSWLSWISMLYSTGMGAGLLLRAVQEPVYYFSHSPRESALSKSDFALQYTFFHWGLTPWAFYGLFGLIIAYNIYGQKKTILSSASLGSRYANTLWSGIIDAVTIICTLLGVVAAAGLGSRQLLGAYQYWAGLQDLPASSSVYIMLIIGILATLSAFLGLNKGIRKISNLNIFLAVALMLFTWMVSGAGGNVLLSVVSAGSHYLREFLPMSLNLGKQQVSQAFLIDWTFFYWAFWLSWAPFTGVFIARISKGRTIKQFIFGALLVPALGTFLWFGIFGNSVFGLLEAGTAEATQFESIYSAIFNFFNHLPLAWLSNSIATVLIFTFLITSVDSAIYVLSMFSDKGNTKPSKKMRLYWGSIISLSTILVILLGKDQLLAAVSQLLILFALPFSFLFVGLVGIFLYSIFKKK